MGGGREAALTGTRSMKGSADVSPEITTSPVRRTSKAAKRTDCGRNGPPVARLHQRHARQSIPLTAANSQSQEQALGWSIPSVPQNERLCCWYVAGIIEFPSEFPAHLIGSMLWHSWAISSFFIQILPKHSCCSRSSARGVGHLQHGQE